MKRWPYKEEDILRQYYPDRGSEYCANLLNKTREAIKLKASRLGLRTYFIPGYWIKEEDAILIKYYTEYGSKYCSKLVNKPLKSIVGRAARLGLSTDIVCYGSPQRRVIKYLNNGKIISLCKIHGETAHYLQNKKIADCILCHSKRAIKNAQTDKGRASIRRALNKYKSTSIGRFTCRLRTSLNNALRSKNIMKTRIGCFRFLPYSPQELLQHLEKIRLLQDNQCPMCYQSYDIKKWTIDHIIPINVAETEEDVLELFVLNNLSLLCGSCNTSKGKRILTSDKIKRMQANGY